MSNSTGHTFISKDVSRAMTDETFDTSIRLLMYILSTTVIVATFCAMSQAVLDCITMVVGIIFHVIVATIKVFLPDGILPRKSVKDEIVLITGGGSGIGRLTAVEFAKLGACLVLWDINEEGNAETKKLIESTGGKAYTYKVDISRRSEIYETAKQVTAEVGDVNILINNAGIVTGKNIFESRDELMEKTMKINSEALFWTAKAFVPKMLEKNHGHVVTIASMAGHTGVAGLADYCASKHAAVGFNESLRAEVQKQHKDIIVTTVNPYYINTGMFDGVTTNSCLFPLLDQEYAIRRIMNAILTNVEDLYLPAASNVYVMLKGLLPTKAMTLVVDYFEVNKTMDHFVGRKKTV